MFRVRRQPPARLLPTSPTTFFAEALLGVTFEFETDSAGKSDGPDSRARCCAAAGGEDEIARRLPEACAQVQLRPTPSDRCGPRPHA